MVVVPGSGCTGWAPVAAPGFAGLLHADVLLLHKPAADPWAGLAPPCTDAFVQQDALGPWLAAAQRFLADHPWVRHPDPTRPVWLVGWSEGAELVPHLAPLVPHLAAVVLLSAPGLDPLALGQAVVRHRPHAQAAWQALAQVVASPAAGAPDGVDPHDPRLQGRSLRYWRDLWTWPVAQPLLDGPWPLVRVWGGRDELLPPDAYRAFAESAQHRPHPWCDLHLPDADHSLQRPTGSAWPWVWAQLETWARSAPVPTSAPAPAPAPASVPALAPALATTSPSPRGTPPTGWLTAATCQAAQDRRPPSVSPPASPLASPPASRP